VSAVRILLLCGGVGGAKLALGLNRGPEARGLGIVVNTGDDFAHLGLHVSPDVDTVLYTLADLADAERGWGRADETWRFMETVRSLGGEDWFQLGDTDLALNVLRTAALASGQTLSAFVENIAARLGIAARVWPMSDAPVRTIVETSDGVLPFQDYFVRRRCEPAVRRIRFDGAERAAPLPAIMAAFADPALECIVIAPSNPYLSIDPILATPAMRDALMNRRVPCVAVSPIVAGRAIKGPTAKLMAELGLPVTADAVARHYGGLIDGMVIDESEPADTGPFDVPVHRAATVMRSLADREHLASETLRFARSLAQRGMRR
jgi:LPPG:FO 2-phospho-L-lactate transferase